MLCHKWWVTTGASHIGYQQCPVQSGEGRESETGKTYRPAIEPPPGLRSELPQGRGKYDSAYSRQGFY